MASASTYDEERLARDQRAFHAYAAGRLQTRAMDVLSGAEAARRFRDSLHGAMAHTLIGANVVDAEGQPLRLIGGFLENSIPNAHADNVGGTHVMGMNVPLFIAVHEFALFCFTQREFFPDIGDPALETSPQPFEGRPPGLWLLDFTKRGGRIEPRHGERATPRGESRGNAAVYLGMLMARFAWLHEFQHCFNGHVRLAQRTGRALYLNEIDDGVLRASFAGQRGLPDPVLQAMELDADASAFWASCMIQLAGRENMEGLAEVELGTRLRLALFGAYAMTWLFEEFQNYLDVRSGVTHPAPYLRLQNLVRLAASRIEPVNAGVAAAKREACVQFDVIQRAIPSLYGTGALHGAASDPAATQALEASARLLAEIEPQLAPLRYAERS